MSYPLLIIFAFLPSFIWLLFYLRKDVHPESNPMVLKIFFYGMAAAILTALIELGFFQETAKLPFSPFLISFLNIFVGVALVEEILKYLVVKEKVLNNPEFDEPIDAMLYMIIAGLGFAALENILIFLSPKVFFFGISETLTLAIFRFISATFLHALCSGILGFFLALSFFEIKKRNIFLTIGLFLAITLHGLYNFSIMEIEGILRLAIPIIILTTLGIAVSFGFKRLKELKSVCKI
ncbi:MAG: PrsW family intramembrane metalloprotease [Patescibacteria group bacterium]|nr:PrsW family intramembrane metalloprotease [Patescibacteria group bacterium]